jgi:peptide alpha-N-acetyltransferase
MADHGTTIAKNDASTTAKDEASTITKDEASIPTNDEVSAAVPPIVADTDLQYIQYDPSKEEQYLPLIRSLISKDLSEPYSIYVYRYFLYQWGDLCYMVLAPSPSPLSPT